MASRTLEVNLTGSARNAKKAFDDVERYGAGLKGKLNKIFNKIKLPAALVGGAAVAGLAILTSKLGAFVSKADEIDKASTRTGVLAENVQKLGFAAEQSGSSWDTVEKGIVKMASALDDAALNPNAPAARALDKIGLSLDDLEGLTTEEKFIKIADALGKVTDDGEQAALSADLFGRSAGSELIPLFEAGAEAIQKMGEELAATGNIMSGDAVAAGAKLNDTWNEIKNAISGIATGALETLLPALTTAMDYFQNTIIPVLKNDVIPVVKQIATVAFAAVETAWNDVLKPVITAIIRIFEEALLPTIRDVIIPLFKETLGEAFEKVKEIWETSLKPTIEAIKGLFGRKGDGGSDTLAGVINVVKKVFEIAWGLIAVVVDVAFGLIFNSIGSIIAVVAGLTRFMINIFQGDWQGAWDEITGIVDTFIGYFTGIIDEFVSLVTGVFDVFGIDIEQVFIDLWANIESGWNTFASFFTKTIPDGIKGGINEIIGLIEALPNAYVRAFNAIIKAWNDFGISTPAVKLLGKTVIPAFNWSTPDIPMIPEVKIPRLAQGGIVRARPGGTLIRAGEGGQDELVAPLGGRGGGFGTTVYNVTINNPVGRADEIADEVFRAMERLHRRGATMRVTI